MNNIYPFKNKIGMGTFGFGNPMNVETNDIESLVSALNIGYTLFDTAEQYANGGAEKVLGKAIKEWDGDYNNIQIISKILPVNATTKESIIKSLDNTLKRLGVDSIEGYLLHWYTPDLNLGLILDTFLEFKQQGKIKTFGLSNFNPTMLKTWKDLEAERGIDNKSKEGATILQTRYNLHERLVDRYMLQFVKQEYDMSVMAHSPFAKRAIINDNKLNDIARSLQMQKATVALAWTIRHPHVVAIPKASKLDAQDINFKALDVVLPEDVLDRLDELFPIPSSPPTI